MSAHNAHVRTLIGHGGKVRGCAFDCTGNSLVTSSWDRTARIWDVASGASSLLALHHEAVWGCCFSPAGYYVATSSWDCTIKLWQAQSLRYVRTLSGLFAGHKDFVYECCFAKEGTRLVSCSKDKTIKVWKPKTGKCRRTFKGHKGAVLSCAVTNALSRPRIASGSRDKTVRIWNSKGSCQEVLSGHSGSVYGCNFSPLMDGGLATASWDGTVRLWDTTRGANVLTFTHVGAAFEAKYSAAGNSVISCGVDQSARIWDVNSGKEAVRLNGHTDAVFCCDITAEMKVATTSGDYMVFLWDVRKPDLPVNSNNTSGDRGEGGKPPQNEEGEHGSHEEGMNGEPEQTEVEEECVGESEQLEGKEEKPVHLQENTGTDTLEPFKKSHKRGLSSAPESIADIFSAARKEEEHMPKIISASPSPQSPPAKEEESTGQERQPHPFRLAPKNPESASGQAPSSLANLFSPAAAADLVDQRRGSHTPTAGAGRRASAVTPSPLRLEQLKKRIEAGDAPASLSSLFTVTPPPEEVAFKQEEPERPNSLKKTRRASRGQGGYEDSSEEDEEEPMSPDEDQESKGVPGIHIFLDAKDGDDPCEEDDNSVAPPPSLVVVTRVPTPMGLHGIFSPPSPVTPRRQATLANIFSKPDGTRGPPSATVSSLAHTVSGEPLLSVASASVTPPTAAVIAASPTKKPSKRALLIGNGEYKHLPRLATSENNVFDLAVVLRGMGFDVTAQCHMRRRPMQKAIDSFCHTIQPGELVFFYFTGHAFSFKEEGYMLPTSFRMVDEEDYEDLGDFAVPVSELVAGIAGQHGSSVTVMCFDSCVSCLRESLPPHDLVQHHLMPTDVEDESKDFVYMFSNDHTCSTKPATEGARNSLYTATLLDLLTGLEELDIDAMGDKLVASVAAATDDEQVPVVYSTLDSPLLL